MWKIPLFDLAYDDRETQAVLGVLNSKWLAMGTQTMHFEEAFAAYLGGGVHCAAVSSCTAALHLALLSLDIGPGDEVIVSGLSFVAALNAVQMVGAVPVLADSRSLDDWNISVGDVERQITNNTRAVIFVHFAGVPADVDGLKSLSEKHQLYLIEDVAHAIGADYKGAKCGTFGDIACFSFFANKNLSTGEGGMFVTPHKHLDEKVRLIRSHGMSSMTVDRHQGKVISYDVVQPGLNYRMDEIRSALGLVQLEKLEEGNQKRGMLHRYYCQLLADYPSITVPFSTTDIPAQSSYHIFPILLPAAVSREQVMNGMKEKGIQTSIHYPAYADFTAYRDRFGKALPVAGEISARVLTLPLFPAMTKQQVETVVTELKDILLCK